MEELRGKCGRISNNKTPGLEGIRNRALKLAMNFPIFSTKHRSTSIDPYCYMNTEISLDCCIVIAAVGSKLAKRYILFIRQPSLPIVFRRTVRMTSFLMWYHIRMDITKCYFSKEWYYHHFSTGWWCSDVVMLNDVVTLSDVMIFGDVWIALGEGNVVWNS